MNRIPQATLERMATLVSAEDRDEMAIPSYLHKNPAMRWMAWRRVEKVAERLESFMAGRNKQSASITDFGCGTGVLLGEASRFADRVIGIDLQLEPGKMFAKEQGLKVEFMLPPDAERDIAPGSQDAVVAAEVLEHVDDVAGTLRFFSRILKPDGRLIVSLPTENALYRLGRKLAGFEGHYHHHNAASIHGVTLAEGYTPSAITCIPAPGPLAVYWVVDYGRPR
jgi:2-polyprenyl-3-methyl-5-hydroxy-6-metoxy-1,4-benzoquinol methylase